jgi:hypothetical protein
MIESGLPENVRGAADGHLLENGGGQARLQSVQDFYRFGDVLVRQIRGQRRGTR